MNKLRTQEITEGVGIKWLADERIVVFKLHSPHQASIDIWAEKVIEVSAEWPEDKPYLAIHDVRNMLLTPYGRKRARDIAGTRPSLRGRYAVMVAPNVIGKAIQMFVNREFRMADHSSTLQGRCFTNFDEGLMWLHAYKPIT